jgi:hypothetical protein
MVVVTSSTCMFFAFALSRSATLWGAAWVLAGGSLTAASRTHNGASFSFKVDAHTDARTRPVLAKPS